MYTLDMWNKLVVGLLAAMILAYVPKNVQATAAIINVVPVTPGSIEQYGKFEVAFAVTGSTYSNPFFPYDGAPPPGVAPGIGVSVDALLLAPQQIGWSQAQRIGCFYYQPYAAGTLVPQGSAQWRCRFTPSVVGTWQYKLQVTDKNGTVQSEMYSFTCIPSARKGAIGLSKTDPRFFAFADGTPFVTPLVTVAVTRGPGSLNERIAKLGQGGIRFVRWFPTTENGDINLYGDAILSSWHFGGTYDAAEPDTARRHTWSYSPYYYSSQSVYLQKGQIYRLTLRANVSGEQVLAVGVGDYGELAVCSATNVLHSPCNMRKSGWNSYVLIFPATATDYADLFMRGLYYSTDAPAPYNEVRSGKVRVSEVVLQRDESGSGGWGPNLVTRGDADTHLYVDQNEAAVMDEILRYSEIYGVYHKLTIFHKNDGILNYYDKDGKVGQAAQCDWGYCPNNFYAGDGQMVRWLEQAYMRYFLARWSYSPAIHSLEYVNESDFTDPALAAGWKYAKYVAENSSRPILTTNSFWGYWVDGFYKDPIYGRYLNYSDKHWYANREQHDDEVISTIWDDTVANVRQCYKRFKEYAAQGEGYHKPFVRGETGVALVGTGPPDPAIAAEPTGTYYHKKVWAHVGLLGYTCDGEWYPRIFESPQSGSFPNDTYDIYQIYRAYEKFVADEPLDNGSHVDLGTDLTGSSAITSTNEALRAYGSKDAVTARALVWVDNKNNTWLNPEYAKPAAGTVAIGGMPPGEYTEERWDTRAGTFSATPNAVRVAEDGVLRFGASTSKDVAFKFYRVEAPEPEAAVYLPMVRQ